MTKGAGRPISAAFGAAAVAVAMLSLGCLMLDGQAGAQSGQTVFRAETRLIHLTIVATTKNGQPVSNLQPDEIEVSENGRRQKLLSFEAAVPAAAPAGPVAPEQIAPRPPAPPGLPAATPPPGLPSRGYIVFVVDESATDRPDRLLALKAIAEWIDKYKAENDQVALLSLGAGVGVWRLFTSDKRLLLPKVEEMKVPAGQGNDEEMVDRLVQTLIECKKQPQQEICAAMTLESFKNEGEALLSRRKGLIWALIEMLKAFPGEKRVVYYGNGFITSPGLLAVRAYELMFSKPSFGSGYNPSIFLRVTDADGLRDLTSAALRANVTFYTVDARGLRAEPPTGTAQHGSITRDRANQPSLDPSSMASFSSERFHAGADSLKALGYDTGGRAYLNSNDLVGSTRQAIGDLAGTYYATYTPDDNEFDGKYRKIEIRVLRPDVAVRTRAGYFAIAAKQLTIKASALPPQPQGTKYQVPLAIQLETAELSWAGQPGKRTDQLAVVMSVFNSRKELLSTNVLYLELPEPKDKRAQLSLNIGAGAGSYTCLLTVTESRTTNFATSTLDINLPPLARP